MVKWWTISSCCTILYQTLMVVHLVVLCPGRADTAPTMSMTTLTLIPKEYSWNEGLALCGEGYGNLLNVMDQTMQNVLVQMHSVLKFESDMWIGLHDRGLESNDDYYWSNCQPLQSDWTNWNSKPLSTSNKLCGLLSVKFLTWYTESCWKTQHILCAKSLGTCTYELKEKQTCSLDVPKKSVNAATLVDCQELCNTEVNGINVCWAYIFHHHDNTCQLIFGSNPYFCENDDVELVEDYTFGLRRCFNFSKVSLVNAVDVDTDIPLLTCPESTSSGAATMTFTTSLDHDTIATTTSHATITDMSSPDTNTTVSSISDHSTTISSAPQTNTTVSSNPDTTTTVGSSSDTSTTGRSSPDTTATRSTPDTTTTTRPLPDTTTTTRPSPDTTTTVGSSSDTTTTRSFPGTTTTTRSAPGTSNTVSSSSSTSSMNSTPTTTVLSSMPTPGASQGAPNENVTSRANVICSCMCLQPLNDLIENLLLDKRNLSAYRRKHESAGDDRPSAQSLGVGGATLLILSVLFVLAADLTRVFSSRGSGLKI